ncbi:MAG: hypothetical protein R3Y26_09810 [Rikenellaceae bacterium]
MMRLFKQIFFVTFTIAIVSLFIYSFGDESSKYIRIFMGVFTGSLLGCITAFINYLGSRKQFLESKYKAAMGIVVNLYGIKSLFSEIKSTYEDSTLNYNMISDLDSKISAINTLSIKVNNKTADTELIGYTPLICKNRINKILANLQSVFHKHSTDFYKDFSKYNIDYLRFKYDAKPQNNL